MSNEQQNEGKENVTVPPPAPDGVDTPPAYYPASSQWQQPVAQPHQPYGYGYPAGGAVQQQSNNVVVVQQPGSAYVTAPPRPNDYLGLSIFACLCCCWPIAIVALVHSCQVNDRYSVGDYAGAVESSERARYWSKVSIIVGSVLSAVWIGIVVLYIISQVALAAAT